MWEALINILRTLEKGIKPDDWIDIWNPTKSRNKISDSGWISIEIGDEKCPGLLGD